MDGLTVAAGVLAGVGGNRHTGETSFLGAQPSVPSELLCEKVLDDVSCFFLV